LISAILKKRDWHHIAKNVAKFGDHKILKIKKLELKIIMKKTSKKCLIITRDGLLKILRKLLS
jgi:hypothetical protein